jgi:hypothetical protein
MLVGSGSGQIFSMTHQTSMLPADVYEAVMAVNATGTLNFLRSTLSLMRGWRARGRAT